MRGPRALARHARRTVQARLARPNREPVIVMGKEKSGTTAIAALLAEHTGSSVTLDVPALFGTRVNAVRSGERRLADVVRRNRLEFSRDVIKQPSFTWIYPQLRGEFPNARFLMITRDPRDTVRSVFNRLDLPGDLPDLDCGRIEALPADWRWHFERPGDLGIPAGTYVECEAGRWNLAAEVYLSHADEMTLLRYEDFLADKEGSIAGSAEALGMRGDRDISHMVDRQFQPRGMREVTWLEFFGQRNLELIERTCADRMRRLGYPAGPPRVSREVEHGASAAYQI